MGWTRPELMNSVRECSKYMKGAAETHMVALKRMIHFNVAAAKRGLHLSPKGIWNGTKDYKFKIQDWSDSEYAKDSSRCSVNGWGVFLCDAPISFRNKMMPIVDLSVAEAELFAAVLCALDMIYALRVLNEPGLKVELPMKLYIDNKGAHDLCHSWASGGRTRHIEVKQYFLRELKEAGIIKAV